MYHLPQELQNLIYEYDPKKRENWDKLTQEFNKLVEENQLRKDRLFNNEEYVEFYFFSSNMNLDDPSYWVIVNHHDIYQNDIFNRYEVGSNYRDRDREEEYLDFIRKEFNVDTDNWYHDFLKRARDSKDTFLGNVKRVKR